MKRVDLVGLAMETDGGLPVVVLREQDEPHRLLPIFIGGTELTSLAVAVSGQETPRPLAHDVVAAVVLALDGHLDAVEVTVVSDGTFRASLLISGPAGEHRIDARPSDALAVAVRMDTPMLVSEQLLEEAGSVPAIADQLPVVGESRNEREIDDEVAEFRFFLDGVDPEAFGLQ